MQLKGFLVGMATASVLWAAVPALADWARSGSNETGPPGVELSQSRVTELRQQDPAMCPFQREARRSEARCPYSGQSRHGGYEGGRAGEHGGLRQKREPLET